jgi:hypothetical protein
VYRELQDQTRAGHSTITSNRNDEGRHLLCGTLYAPFSIPARPLDAVDYENLDGRPLRFEFQAAPLLQWATSWKHSAGKL